jgi:hypothetical protein
MIALPRGVRWALYGVALALVLSPCVRQENGDERSLIERLFGPFAELAANVQWVRADNALRHARYEIAYARAEHALELAPSPAGGWIFLARHFVYERASLEREPDAEARRRWTQAGLDVLERGRARCAQPAELEFERGVILTFLALVASDPALPPADAPSSRKASALFDDAARAYDRATELGHAEAAELAAAVRERARLARGAGR